MERAAYPPRTLDRLGPELGYFREVGTDPAALVDSLAGTRVTVVGLGAVGAVAATALAAANVGHIRCVDSSTISPADPYLAQLFGLPDVGLSRAEVVRDKIELVNPTVSVEVFSDELETDRDVTAAIEGSNFVLGCLDPGLLSITYRLNRAVFSQELHGVLAPCRRSKGSWGRRSSPMRLRVTCAIRDARFRVATTPRLRSPT